MTFLRRVWMRYSKLGKGKKKKKVWRKPKGRDNKIREMKKGYPSIVKVGYKTKHGTQLMPVHNLQELSSAKQKQVLFAKVGGKKRKEMEVFAKENNIIVLNKKSVTQGGKKI